MKGLIANKIDVFNGISAVMLYDYCVCWGASVNSAIANKGVEITGDRGIVLCGCCGQGNISFITGYVALVVVW